MDLQKHWEMLTVSWDINMIVIVTSTKSLAKKKFCKTEDEKYSEPCPAHSSEQIYIGCRRGI